MRIARRDTSSAVTSSPWVPAAIFSISGMSPFISSPLRYISVAQASGRAFFPSAAKRLRIHCTSGPWPWEVKLMTLPH